MNIYWLNPPPRTNSLPVDLGWMNFRTACKGYNWIQPILDWEEYEHISEIVDHIIQNDTEVLCASTYMWNHQLVHEILTAAKKANPNIIIIRGGPHQGYDETFFERFPYIDYLCYSTGHGELFLIEALNQLNKYKTILFPNNVPYLISKNFKSKILSGRYHYPDESSFEYNLEYLSLLVSTANFKGKKTIIPFETSRGCPYSCVYCEWGGGIGTKVSKRSMDVIKKDIEVISYLGLHDLELIDANFGIFDQDIEILNCMLEYRKITGYPESIMTYGLAKVKPEKKQRILEAMFAEGMTTTYSMSMQTIDDTVMKNLKRTDITVQEQINLAQKFIDKYNAVVKVEIIMGIPGTTLDIFYDECDVFQQIGSWFNSRNLFILLPDSEAYSKEYREKFKIKSAVVGACENDEELYYDHAKGVISKYKSPTEIVVSTYSFTIEDWKEMFFVNHAQRVLGPKIPKGEKASIVLRKWFNKIKNEPWYIEIDQWMNKFVNNEMMTVNTDKYNDVFLEKYVEDNFNGF